MTQNDLWDYDASGALAPCHEVLDTALTHQPADHVHNRMQAAGITAKNGLCNPGSQGRRVL